VLNLVSGVLLKWVDVGSQSILNSILRECDEYNSVLIPKLGLFIFYSLCLTNQGHMVL